MNKLLVIEVNGKRYAVPGEQVSDVREGIAIHHLPLSPAWLAGIALLDGRTVTLADLSPWLGEGLAAKSTPLVLMLGSPGKISGFVTEGRAVACEAADGSVLPLPGHLATAVINACVVLDGEAVPLLDLYALARMLPERLSSADRRPLLQQPVRETAQDRVSVRIFSIGGLAYAVPASVVEGAVPRPPTIMGLPQPPPFVHGVALHENSLLPVIDLSPALVRGTERAPAGMLLLNVGTGRIGLLVERDLGTSPGAEVVVRDLPQIARSPGMQEAVVRSGQIIPLLDLTTLLSDASVPAASFQYGRDSSCPSQFLRQDIEVTEFTLAGLLHAVPQCEVEAIVPFRPFRPMPNTSTVVAGVAEHAGEVLPVIDLGPVFGRRQLPTPDWSLILLRNGDFRALILAERVLGDRTIGLAMQRELPLVLPYPMIYGCYPENAGVRLVLNVMELVLHFEKAGVQELLSTVVAGEPQAEEAAGQKGAGAEQAEVPVPSGEAVGETADQGSAETADAAMNAAGSQVPSCGPEAAGEEEVQPAVEVEQETSLSETAAVSVVVEVPVEASGTVILPQAAHSSSAVEEPAIRDRLPAATPAPGDGQEAMPRSEPAMPASAPPVPGNRVWMYAAAAVAMLFTVFAVLLFRGQPSTKRVSRPPAVVTKAGEDKKTQPVVPAPVLELEIPATMPLPAELYIVKEGDTLWSISERFTGTPFNYPKIAGENRIADPDLIFPGQKIRLIRR